MNESLIIRNFGPIKEIELVDIRPFTIFIGESGSGKSTIMKVLALFRWIYKMVNIRSYLKHANISKSPFRFQWQTYVQNNGFEKYLNKDTAILYKKGGFEISYNGKKLKSEGTIPLKDLSLEKICFISDKRNLISDILANRAEKKTTGFFLRETLDDFNLSSREIKELPIEGLPVKLIIKKLSTGTKYYIEGTNPEASNYSIHLEDASSGTQTITPLSLIVEYYATKYNLVDSLNQAVLKYLSLSDKLGNFKPAQHIGDIEHRTVNILVEEPELSLYPTSQLALIDFLVDRTLLRKKDYQMTMMIATHSPYIVNYINVLLRRSYASPEKIHPYLHPDDVAVYRVVNGHLQNLMATDKKTRQRVVNTIDLSEPMNRIFQEYVNLAHE